MRQHQSKIKRELICKRPSAGYSHSIMSRYKQLSEKRWFKIAFDIAKAWISNSIVGLRLNNSMNLRWEPICHSILNIFAAIAIQSMAFHKIILLVVVILNIKHSFSPAFKSNRSCLPCSHFVIDAKARPQNRHPRGTEMKNQFEEWVASANHFTNMPRIKKLLKTELVEWIFGLQCLFLASVSASACHHLPPSRSANFEWTIFFFASFSPARL